MNIINLLYLAIIIVNCSFVDGNKLTKKKVMKY